MQVLKVVVLCTVLTQERDGTRMILEAGQAVCGGGMGGLFCVRCKWELI